MVWRQSWEVTISGTGKKKKNREWSQIDVFEFWCQFTSSLEFSIKNMYIWALFRQSTQCIQRIFYFQETQTHKNGFF